MAKHLLLVSLIGLLGCTNNIQNADPDGALRAKGWSELKFIPIGVDSSAIADYRTWVRVPPSEVGVFPPSRQVVVSRLGEIDRTIKRLDDFAPLLQIRSASDALSVIRLLTDDRTRSALPDWVGWEIGDNGRLLNRDGRVDAAILQRIRWQSPRITHRAGQDWCISRFVLLPRRLGDPRWKIVRLEERISDNGHYKRTEQTEVYSGELPDIQSQYEL